MNGIQEIPNEKIAIIGDIILDKILEWKVSRLNPEWPMPLIDIEHEEWQLWWAANVAANIVAMWKWALLFGALWDDENRRIVHRLCETHKIYLHEIPAAEPTMSKVRVMDTAYHQQLLRMDYGKAKPISNEAADKMIKAIEGYEPDLIIISDYIYWFGTEYLARWIIHLGIPVIVDAKPGRMPWFKWALALKPNFKEFAKQVGIVPTENTDVYIRLYGPQLAASLDSTLIVTRSEHGASVITKTGEVTLIPTAAKEVFDVTGAGDTFLAAMGIGITSGMNLQDAAKFANKASGIAVGKSGTVVVTKEMLDEIDLESD